MAQQRNKQNKQGGPRSAARLAVVQAHYQLLMADEPKLELVTKEYIDHRLGAELEGEQFVDADAELFSDILKGSWERRQEWRDLIEPYLSKEWSFDRLDKILLATLCAGSYELVARIDVPAAVVINEYVDVTHGFYERAEASFINSILDKLSKDVRQ
ncbi:transcription antitermination factor NusB [Kordiimonas aquimaris]|uniref:transcription antitermination factor NusB n=1 Tax=Kordiimonas aquimaris TaxID=707591 RepID=UPI0021D070B7|nr:transcription antitermination factor NusB [Kordiimonas aquimaris]